MHTKPSEIVFSIESKLTFLYVIVWVCVCESDREREREKKYVSEQDKGYSRLFSIKFYARTPVHISVSHDHSGCVCWHQDVCLAGHTTTPTTSHHPHTISYVYCTHNRKLEQ